MQSRTLLVDLDSSQLENWQAKIANFDLKGLTQAATSYQDALVHLRRKSYNACVVFSEHPRLRDLNVIKAFFSANFALPSLMLIICDVPAPQFLSDVNEFGVENFAQKNHWVYEVERFANFVESSLQDRESPESLAWQASEAVKNPKLLKELVEKLRAIGEFHYLYTYVRGVFLCVQGSYDEAVLTLKAAINLNPFFIPAKSKLAEALMILGKSQEAVKVLSELENLNDQNIERKIALANAHTDMGAAGLSQDALNAAIRIDPQHKGLIEAKIHELLKNHQYNEAVRLIDDLEEVGPHLASKLNDLGVKLSKAGKGKSAMLLYQKAHNLVRPELKYKISVNAALAEFRLGDPKKALGFLNRSEQEYGGPFSKSINIREKIEATLSNAEKGK